MPGSRRRGSAEIIAAPRGSGHPALKARRFAPHNKLLDDTHSTWKYCDRRHRHGP